MIDKISPEIIIIFSILVVVSTVLGFRINSRRVKSKYKNLYDSLILAMNGINVEFFEYYPDKKEAILLNSVNSFFKDIRLENFPEIIYKNNQIHPDDLGQLKERFAEIESGRESVSGEIRFFIDGEYKWYSYQMNSVYKGDGEREKVTICIIDITAQKEMEKGYQRHLNALFFDNPDTLISCRMNLSSNKVTGIYTVHKVIRDKLFVSANVDDIFGKLSDYVVPSYRKHCLDMFSRDNLIKEYYKGNTTIRDSFCYFDHNEVRWAEIVIEMMVESKHGEIDAVFHTFDITYKHIMELMLESSGNHDYDFMTFVFGKTQRFLRYNWLGTQNLRFHEKYGEKLLNYIHYLNVEDEKSVVEKLSWENITEHLDIKGEYTVFATMYQQDGTRKRKKLQFFYIDENEKLILVSQRDITDVYEAEIHHREELSKALEEAKAANAAKSDFLSRMSHDIRTPMNAIIGLTELALDEVDNREMMEDSLKKINSSSHFLLGLINDILDMSKIENGAVTLHKEYYSYEEFIENIKTMFEPLCKKNGIAFKVLTDCEVKAIKVDRVRLNQIFFNIISNAIKYTKEGSISFWVEKTKIHDNFITITYEVEDTGIGMSKEFQEHMFTPFSQEQNEFITEVQGTGLGLSITKNLVELMGGEIEVFSEKGKGTRIQVELTFEIALERKPENKKIVENKDEILEGLNILLVEDHPLNTEIAKRILLKKKMNVFTAKDGEEGVNMFLESGEYFYDAILMDIRMPKMDGLTATRNIRNMEREDAKTVPIVAMTANAYEEDVKLSQKAGMNEHLSKPIQPAKLYEILTVLKK